MGTPGVPSCHLLSCGLELLNKCNDRRPGNHDKLYEESGDRREQTGFGKAVVCDPRPWLDIWTGCRRISVCTPASQGGVCHGFAFRCRSNPPFCLNVASGSNLTFESHELIAEQGVIRSNVRSI